MTAPSRDEMGKRLSLCAAMVRRHDRDRYLTALFAPSQAREHLFALYAFNLEIAKIAEVVHEPMLGMIRLQWWREEIGNLYAGRAGRHAVSAPLAEAVRDGRLARANLEALLAAREQDLDGDPPATVAALESYAEDTSSTLMWMALEILGALDDSSRAVARHLGIAWALIGLLRAVPFHARGKRLYLPRDLCAGTGLKTGDLFELRSTPALCEAVAEIAAIAQAHLDAARSHTGRPSRAALPALLPGVLAARYATDLRRAGYDPLTATWPREAPAHIWRLAWAWLVGRYC